MHWLGWTVVLLALVESGWLTFDGIHAFATGDFVTPKSGEYAGKLGPWSHVVSAVGIEPRSTLMKSIHVGLGVAWLATIGSFVFRFGWARPAMIVCAALGLWYLPIGTILGLIQIVILLLPALRQ